MIVVGAGPAGLFAALRLAQAGVPVTLLERGQPVERRGRDIGALCVRRVVDPESNLLYGEGGAGTWSDGKLTTRIGRNSEAVRGVLHALVSFGAPEEILVKGKPHLGTDRMVRILRQARETLLELGVDVRFGTCAEAVLSRRGRASGVRLAGSGEELEAAAVVLGIGHSARDLYERLHADGEVALEFKPFAAGFRGEHPQELVNRLQYGDRLAGEAGLGRGDGKLPVADYRLVAKVDTSGAGGAEPDGCYSFCMCPGGQVVATTMDPDEMCVNGMSFSRRASRWANSGLVVPIDAADCAPFVDQAGDDVLAGLRFQRAMERDAAVRGGGDLTCPVQTMVDFVEGVDSRGALPSSSYRLGTRAASLHELYPPQVTEALRQGLEKFDRSMRGYLSPLGLLHGVETRTSAPVRVVRDGETLQSPTLAGLFPVGEGAGYAGGIVSAAVDGDNAAAAVLTELGVGAATAGAAA